MVFDKSQLRGLCTKIIKKSFYEYCQYKIVKEKFTKKTIQKTISKKQYKIVKENFTKKTIQKKFCAESNKSSKRAAPVHKKGIIRFFSVKLLFLWVILANIYLKLGQNFVIEQNS